MAAELDGFVRNDEFGQAAVYHPSLDDPVIPDTLDCDIILEFDAVLQPSSYDAQVVETGTIIEALYRDIAEPRHGSHFVVGDKKYVVERIMDNDRVFVRMAVTEEDI